MWFLYLLASMNKLICMANNSDFQIAYVSYYISKPQSCQLFHHSKSLFYINYRLFSYADSIKYSSTTIPSTIRYQPNTLKSFFLIYPIRNRITTTDTTNATTIPTAKMVHSAALNAMPNFRSFNRLAPNITGIARKKVNSAATVLEIPSSNAPIIVAPEREVPGKTAATSCHSPMTNAIL